MMVAKKGPKNSATVIKVDADVLRKIKAKKKILESDKNTPVNKGSLLN